MVRIKRLVDEIFKILVLLWMVFIFFFLVFPIVVCIGVSFDPRGTAASFPPETFSLRWYEYFLNNPYYIPSLTTSLIIALLVTTTSLIIGIPASLALVRYDFKGKDFINSLMMSPLIIPTIVSGAALVNFLMSLGMRNSFINLIIGHTIIALPYVLRVVSACLYGIDISVEEAAMSLGANRIQTFIRITLPLIRVGVIASALFAFVASFGNVTLSVFLADPYTTTFPVVLFSRLVAMYDPSIATASVFLMGTSLIFAMIVERTLGLDAVIGFW